MAHSDIESLLRKLEATPATGVNTLVRELAELDGPDAKSALLELTTHPDFHVRRAALHALLSKLPDDQCAIALRGMLKDPVPHIRQHIIDRFDVLLRSSDVIPMTIRTLQDEDNNVRERAITRLTARNAVEALPNLQDALLHDPSKNVRRRAAEGVGRLWNGDEQLIEALKSATLDRKPSVRAAAASALGKIAREVPAHQQRILECLSPLALDPDLDVRYEVVLQLGYFTPRPDIETILISRLNDRAESAMGDSIARIASLSLKRFGTPEALAAVEAWRASQRGE